MRYWWVNLGKTFRIAVREGFMWCPCIDARSRPLWHWQTMHDVNPGDLVFANWDGAIRAIGVAETHSRDAARPSEGFEFDWQMRGWRVDVTFLELAFPIEISRVTAELLRHRDDRYSPISATGRPVQGYLSNVNPEMAALLLQRLDPIAQQFLTENSVRSLGEVRDAEDVLHEQELAKTPDLNDLQRTAIVEARRGQGLFRQNVERFEHHCKVTGVSERSLLHACHIKPWRVSTASEKIDGENGLLLSPHVHTLFDRGLISFNESGSLLVSEYLEPSVQQAWAIRQCRREVRLTDRQNEFLEFHRRHVYEP